MHHHNFTTSKYKDYEICECGTYRSIALAPRDELYVNNNYWGDGTGRSTLDQQCSNLTCTDECGISKVDRVMQFVPMGGKVAVEIGAAPGVLLKRLLDYGYEEVIGIEPSRQYIEFICNQARGAVVVQGYYPDVILPNVTDVYDLIVGMDVMEHTHDYEDFFKTTWRVLKDGGKAIFMSPIIFEDGFIREGEFKADEHAWLFSKQFLQEYLSPMFSEVKFARWIVSHEILILKK